MDNMNITSTFTTSIISTIIEKQLRKKMNVNSTVQFNSIKVSINDGKTYLHVDAEATLSNENLLKLLKEIGL